MTGLFGGGKAPTLPAPMPAPPPPTVDQAAQSQQADSQARQKRGAMANVLAGAQPAAPQTALTKLLGQ